MGTSSRTKRMASPFALFLAVFALYALPGSALKVATEAANVPECPTQSVAPSRSEDGGSDKIRCQFANHAPYPINVYWVSRDGQEEQETEIAPGNIHRRLSFPGHVFRVRQAGSQQCQRLRKMSDTADNGYSNRNHRLGVQRVSQGPGYLKMSINPELVKTLTAWAAKHSQFWRNQTIYQKKVFNPAESVGGCYSNTHAFPFGLLDLDNARHIRKEIVEHMQDVLEWWTDRKLDHTSTYGMRVYRREAMLINHADRGDTHIASAVLQVFQDCDKDGGWPLEVVGEDGLVREVYLQPGEMVLYEGARLLHGRPMRFKGDYFGNIFSHFSPASPTHDDYERSDL